MAGATPEQVLAAAAEAFAAGERVDVRAVADRVGIGRASIYRWFGDREQLLGEMLRIGFLREFERALEQPGPRGAARVLAVCEHLMLAYRAAAPMHHFVATEPALARRLITDPDGPVHPVKVEALRELISAETGKAGWVPPIPPDALAYVAIHLMDDLNFASPEQGLKGDLDRLLGVLRALLGMTPAA